MTGCCRVKFDADNLSKLNFFVGMVLKLFSSDRSWLKLVFQVTIDWANNCCRTLYEDLPPDPRNNHSAVSGPQLQSNTNQSAPCYSKQRSQLRALSAEWKLVYRSCGDLGARVMTLEKVGKLMKKGKLTPKCPLSYFANICVINNIANIELYLPTYKESSFRHFHRFNRKKTSA